VGPRAGLDVCGKSRLHRDFFFGSFCPICSFRDLCVQVSFLCPIVLRAVDFSITKYPTGFGRERTRDLGFQRPARKPLDHLSHVYWLRDAPTS
jgi:hypothetical protein